MPAVAFNVIHMNTKLHPFEQAGMGIGPFTFVGVWSLPSPALAEANSEAYNNALREMPKLVGGCGTCACCGMAIVHICIISNAAGERYGVGSDCVEKTGDPHLGNAAKVAVARRLAQQRRDREQAKRRAAHAVWLASSAGQAATAQREEAVRAREQAQQIVLAQWGFVLPILDAQAKPGNFCASVAASIRAGHAPTGRAFDIVREIYGKAHGRYGSKAFEAAVDGFDNKIV
jgi:hypothetical protein